MAKKGFTVHIDEQVIDNFRTYCNLNALKVSAKIEILLKKELKNAKINPTLVEMFEKILDGQKILRAHKSNEQTKVAGCVIENNTNKTESTEDTEERKSTEEKGKIDEKSQFQKRVPTINDLKRRKEI